MRPALRPLWQLKIRHNRAYIERRTDARKVAALTAPEAVALALMNGQRELPDVRQLLLLMVGEQGSLLLAALLERLKPLLVDGLLETGTSPPLEKLAAVQPPHKREGLRPLPGPRTLHWWVTSYCPRRCAYCFAEPRPGSHAPDATLPRENLREIFREAAGLGAENLLVAGAEPLLRPDLPEVMGDAVQSGILPLLTTKHPISLGLAGRLAAAGLRHLSLSLDTTDPQESKRIIGSAAWPEQVRRSARHLRKAGVAFSIQAVTSRLNPTALDGVAKLATQEKALVMQVVPFEPVAQPITAFDNEQMELANPDQLDDEVGRLQAKFPRLRVERFEELGSGSRGGLQCDIGMTKLFFLPDGVVHRCYKLTRDSGLCGKDLKVVSVAEAWHDPGFVPIISPVRESYRGSSCFDCGRFDACHDDGRCIFQARQNHGSYYAPDRKCGGPFSRDLVSIDARAESPSPSRS